MTGSAEASTILVVDDEPHNRKLLELLLKPEGYVTRVASSGEQALASIAENLPDLILLDVLMPGMDGYQVAAALKGDPATSNIPIIMVTALNDRDARLAGLKAGAEEFLNKPVDRAELWLRVRNLLRLKAYGDLLQSHGVVRDRLLQTRTAELERFRAAMEVSGDAILLIDRASMRYIDVNRTFCDLVGRTREEVLGLGPVDLFGADRETLEREYDALIADNESSANRFEGTCLRKDGSLVPIESRRRALRTDDGWIIVCTARDVTTRHAAEAALRTSEREQRQLERFCAAMDATVDAIYLVDRPTMCFAYVNAAACRIQGVSREALLATGPDVVLATPREELERTYDAIIASGKPADPLEILRTRSDGSQAWLELRRHPLPSDEGWMVVTLVRDVTERKAAEFRIAYLNRVYAVLSGINTLIVRVLDRDELFREACRIAVEAGGFRMAWIGVVDPGTGKVALASSAGTVDALLAGLKEYFASSAGGPAGDSAAARAIRDKAPIVLDDLQTNPLAVFSAVYAQTGVNSGVMLPLVVGKLTVGVMALYARENGFFHEAEMTLLTELAGDIAFAIDHIGKQHRLDYLAYYDVLTGLANRTLFLERLGLYMRSAAAEGHGLAVFLIDLERFKSINDSLGQALGDTLLKLVAQWLSQATGDANLLARLGADHFALVLPKVRSDGNVERLLEKVMEQFHEHPFGLDDAVFRLSAKVGVALFSGEGADPDTVLKNAEVALKKAKSRGERYVFYEPDMTASNSGKLTLENQLRAALDNGEFVLHYQPKVNLASGKLSGAEALIRWNDPRTGLVPPGRFIPVLEEIGLIYEVGRWALRQSIADYLRWRAAGLAAVRIAVNVSPLQMRNRAFVDEIRRNIEISAGAPAGLELEITESLVMQDVKHSIASLQAIRAMGVKIAIDDFGTGFSSLSYLARLPVDTLKIDRSFVTAMTTSPDGLSLVTTVIKLAHSLRLGVVAEGVETAEQEGLLRLLNCNEYQGFLFSKPVPAEVFEARFLAAAHLPAAALA
jgi:diguanylate cyclase (GGDEF)-like protein/PAS domain S-box-containing protein